MKKILFLLLVGIVACPANASVLDKVHLTGEVQTIAASTDHNTTFNYNIWGENYDVFRGTRTRAMAGVTADVKENVKANLLWQYVYDWGDRNYTNNGFQNGDGIKLANANVAITDLFDAFDITVGRQFYGDEDSAVMYFGPTHYNAAPRMYAKTLDGATFTYHNDFWKVTLMGGKIGNAEEVYNPSYGHYVKNADTFGGDVEWRASDKVTLQAYMYDFQAPYMIIVPYNREYKHHGLYGAKLNWTPAIYRFSVEYARNLAYNHMPKEHHQGSYDSTYMVKTDVAADLGSTFTARGTFLYSNGLTYVYGNYTPGLIMGELFSRNIWTKENVFGLFTAPRSAYGSVRLFNLGFDYKPADKWEISLDGYSFQDRLAEKSATLEADLVVKYDYSNYVQFFAGVGYVKNGGNGVYYRIGSMKELYGSDNSKVQVGSIVRF